MSFYRLLSIASIAVTSVSAFKDTSPFLLLSTSELSSTSPPGPFAASAEDISSYTFGALRDCPSDTYIIVNQPGVSSLDISKQTIPHLGRLFSGQDETMSTMTIVQNGEKGYANGLHLQKLLRSQCNTVDVSLDGSESVMPTHKNSLQTISVNFGSLPQNAVERVSALNKHDSYLDQLIFHLPSKKYTVIYTTSPRSADFTDEKLVEHQYEMDELYPFGMHTDLKRDLSAYPRASNGSNMGADLPLFERYQYLNPGLFMGLTVSLLLLVILYVGISAISGLEVSYMAFSKEMGPTAQKKQ